MPSAATTPLQLRSRLPRVNGPRRCRYAAALLVAISTACATQPDEPSTNPPKAQTPRRKGKKPALDVADAATATRPRWSPSPETLEETAKITGFVRRVEAQPTPERRIAFFARNIAILEPKAVLAVPIDVDHHRNPCQLNRLAVDEPRELAPLADQSLLIIAARQTLVLDSNCRTTTELPKVSYIPGNRLLVEPRWPRAFAVLDTPSGNLERFHWDPANGGGHTIFLPASTFIDPNLQKAECASMRDASLACVKGNHLFVAWPGHPSRGLGPLDTGAPVVRLLHADRADRMHVLRKDATLEEYQLAAPTRNIEKFTLPREPFDISLGRGFIAVLQVESSPSGSAQSQLVVLETNGVVRWSRVLERIPLYTSEQQWSHEYFACRQIVAHPTRPWIAVSNCTILELYDARSGALLQRIERDAPHHFTPQ